MDGSSPVRYDIEENDIEENDMSDETYKSIVRFKRMLVDHSRPPKKEMLELGYCVNLHEFEGKSPGTVLFNGANSKCRANGEEDAWDIECVFSYKPEGWNTPFAHVSNSAVGIIKYAYLSADFSKLGAMAAMP